MSGEGSASFSTLTPGIFKQRYPNGVTWAGLKQSKFYNLCKKSTSFGEDYVYITVQLTAGTGGSPTFAKALANRGAGTTAKFTVSPKKDYVIGSIDNEILAAGNAGAIVNNLLHQFDMKGKEFGELIDRHIIGENGGAIGRLAASGGVSGSTIVMRTKAQARNVRPGMKCEASSDAAGATMRTSGGSNIVYTVSSVVVATKTITMTASTAGWSNSDYVWLEGEAASNWAGYLVWVPSADPSGTSVGTNVTCSADLSTDVWRLGGFRPSSGAVEGSLVGTIQNACAEGMPYGINGAKVIVSPADWTLMEKEIEHPNRDTVKSNVDANVGFKSIVIETAAGSVNVLADGRWPDDVFFWGDPEGWTLLSRGPYPAMPGKGNMLEESADDAWQFRFRGYACLIPTDVSLRESCTGIFRS